MCWNLEQICLLLGNLCGLGWVAEESEVRSLCWSAQSEFRHTLPWFWSAFLSAEFSRVALRRAEMKEWFSNVFLTRILCFSVTRWFLQHSPPPLSAVRKETTCCLLWAWTTWATPATWTASCRWGHGQGGSKREVLVKHKWVKSVYSGCSIKGISLQWGEKRCCCRKCVHCGCPDWVILQFPYSGLLPAVKNPGSLCAVHSLGRCRAVWIINVHLCVE